MVGCWPRRPRDGTTRLWDVAAGRPIGTALPGIAGHDVAAAFVDGGTHLVTVDDNGRGFSWDVRPRSWAQRACDVAGRTLTRAEWDDLLPNRPYARRADADPGRRAGSGLSKMAPQAATF